MPIKPINRKAVARNNYLLKNVGLTLVVLNLAVMAKCPMDIDPSLLQKFLFAVVASLYSLQKKQEKFKLMEYAIVKGVVEAELSSFLERNRQSQLKRKRKRFGQHSVDTTSNKRRLCRHDHERALQCAKKDWIGDPEQLTFTDVQFEQTFRVTRSIVESLLQACCKHERPHFVPGPDCTGKPGIGPEVKMIQTLKSIGFGCSNFAFMDYGQMARNTGTETIKSFFRGILADDTLRAEYLREPTPEDVRRICELHLEKHGVAGHFLDIDCVHIYWKNCPVAWQCHFKNGKNDMSSVVLEAGVDYNTYIWSASAGHPGTNNDVNTWDSSPLLSAFLSNEFNETCDFEFTVDGINFFQVWCLVDGIYPPIARFVKTLSFPSDSVGRAFTEWQESARKPSERAFGILFRKFQILARPLEYWYLEDVKNIIYGCIMLHNMMVRVRIERNEEEDENLYKLAGNKKEAMEAAEHLSTYMSRSQLKNASAEELSRYHEVHKQRYSSLYDEEAHIKLQLAVMNQVASNKIVHKKGRAKRFVE